MGAPRIIVSGATTAITRRCAFRKAFLAPWDPRVKEAWLYSLAFAQEVTGVAIHHGQLVVNHEHLDTTPSSDNLPVFTHLVHRDMSCALNTLLAENRYDAPRELWDGREPHYMRLLDAQAQASQLVYEHLNTVAAGLVERPEHMPDFVFDFGLWKTGSITVRRPDFYFSKDRPETLELLVTPPPLLYAAFGGDMERLVYYMEKLCESGLSALRRERTRPVVGVRRVLRIHPWAEPRTLRERGGERVPSFRVGARGIVGVQREVACVREVHGFRRRHAEVRIARRDGDSAAVYPFGTYEAPLVQGAPVEGEPASDAIVCRPGPLLCDVRAELERARTARSLVQERTQALCTEVEAAFREEAAAIVAHTAIELDPPRHGRGAVHAADEAATSDGERPTVVVQHRFDEPIAAGAADRLVTLRDRRRGRPRKDNRHGTDPPV
jgi:hypothetical protein